MFIIKIIRGFTNLIKGFINLVKQILFDSLTTDGRYSSKKLQMLVSFGAGVVSIFIDQLTEHKLNIEALTILMVMAGYMPTLNTLDKKIVNKGVTCPTDSTVNSDNSSEESK
jgi:hypothetical protein